MWRATRGEKFAVLVLVYTFLHKLQREFRFKRGNHWLQKRDAGQKFIANSTGLGGRSVERLSKGCTSYKYEYLYKDAFLDYLDNTKAAVQAQNKTVKCVAIIFMQGEYNYDGYNKGQGFTNGTDGTTDKDEYKSYLL